MINLESVLEMGKSHSEGALWEKSREESLSGLEEHFPVLLLGVRNYSGVGISTGVESCVRLGRGMID